MYNIPSTAVTEVEALNVIMGATQSLEPQPPQQGEGGDVGAPQRYPKF